MLRWFRAPICLLLIFLGELCQRFSHWTVAASLRKTAAFGSQLSQRMPVIHGHKPPHRTGAEAVTSLRNNFEAVQRVSHIAAP